MFRAFAKHQFWAGLIFVEFITQVEHFLFAYYIRLGSSLTQILDEPKNQC
jgi:hypothetical protein